MEQVIYKCYQKFIKEEDKDRWKEFSGLPKKFWKIFILIVISSVVALWVYSSENSSTVCALLIWLIPYGLCGWLYYWIETYKIEMATESLSDYIKYCEKLKMWIEAIGINEEEKIKELVTRTKERIHILKQEKEKVIEKIVGFINVLIIPIILIVVSNYGKEEADFIIAFAKIITIVIVFTLLFVAFFLVANTINMVKTSKIARMERFCTDLQSVLDLEIFELKEIEGDKDIIE